MTEDEVMKDSSSSRDHDHAASAKPRLDGESHTPGPWFVLDQRATTLRAQGWAGERHDAILISNYPPAEIRPGHCDCIVARITFANRSEELGESNMADARMIAAAPEIFDACRAFVSAEDALLAEMRSEGKLPDLTERPWSLVDAMRAAIAKATGTPPTPTPPDRQVAGDETRDDHHD